IVETIASVLGMDGKLSYAPAQPEHFHPGRTAAIVLDTAAGPATIGYVGQLHPASQLEWELADTYVVELELDPVYEYANFDIVYRTLPRYPAMERDIAVVVNADVAAGDLTAAATRTAGALLES